MLLQFNCNQSPLYQRFTSPCAKPFVNNTQDRAPRAEKFVLEEYSDSSNIMNHLKTVALIQTSYLLYGEDGGSDLKWNVPCIRLIQVVFIFHKYFISILFSVQFSFS